MQFYHSFPDLDIKGKVYYAAQKYKWNHLELPSLKNKQVLDIGAASGWYSLECEKLGAQVFSINKDSGHNAQIKEVVRLTEANIKTYNLDLFNMEVNHKFDIVLFLGVLYHMKNPYLGIEKCFSVTKDLCVIETHVDDNDLHSSASKKSYMRFIPDDSLNNDKTNWWAPSAQCVIDMCDSVGFKTKCIHRHHDRAIFHCLQT